MRDLGKVNSLQIYNLWLNLTVGLMAIILTIGLSNALPYYLSPIVSLLVASGLYFYIYNFRFSHKSTCIMVALSILYCIVGFAFLTIILNLLHVWGLFEMPGEFVFFTHPFIPSLILNPISFIVMLYIYFGHEKLRICIECRLRRTQGGMRGAGGVLNLESHLQLKNFAILFGFLTAIVWIYYLAFYNDININNRDSYIFTWLTILGILVDELYFSIRYYNLYLDLKEGNELLTPRELQDMTAKTYLRFYVICGDYMYLSKHEHDPYIPDKEVIDTPFFTKQTVNGVIGDSVKDIISRMTEVDNGELRFFYGRKSVDDNKHSLLRYFYFLDGDISDHQNMPGNGEWVSFDKIKYLYSKQQGKIAELAVLDISRLATIMLTEKIFDENGYRKSKIKTYVPTFSLIEVRNSPLDFHDDKWLRVSLFNSDTPLYRLKRWWRNRTGRFNKLR